MTDSGKPNGGSHANGTAETLARIARLISVGDEQSAIPDGDPGETGHGGGDDSPGLEDLTSDRLLEALPAGLAVFQGTELLNANSAFALAFGYRDADELKRSSQKQGVFTAKRSKLSTLLSDAENSQARTTKLKARTCSGRHFAIPVAVHPIASESGEPARLIVLHPEMNSLSEEPEPRVSADAARKPISVTTDDRKAAPDAPEEKKRKKKKKTKQDTGKSAISPQSDITEFLARVSHELRTPLNSIIGFAELMKDEQLGPVENERYRGYIRDIHDSGIYALSLVNDLLDISKIKSGEFELNFTAVDLEEVITESVQSMEPQAQRRRVLLRTSLGEGLPAVLADRRSMRQIILNLVSNAIKFTMPGGQVIVSLLETERGAIRMRVRDTGIGMSKSEVALAMKPYKRVEQPEGEMQAGTGLGLPLTRALVEANRARFKVRSTAGTGTRVDVTFPRDRVAQGRD